MNEPGLRSLWMCEKEGGGIWDFSLGGRGGMIRWGSNDLAKPEGWQIDIEGAGLGRLDLDHKRDLVATDYRVGVPISWGNQIWQMKYAYYHISSHQGDEYALQYPNDTRINYVRDELLIGASYTPNDVLRLYGEVGWAFKIGEGTRPWEFQFGAEYSKMTPDTVDGSPFAALNAHLRQEADFGGGLTVQTGWQWRGETGRLIRLGFQFYEGKSDQFVFWNRYERKIGGGLWYNF
jgi:hypothetical protein